MLINTSTIETDINREQARRAYHGTSFSPEKRGDSFISSYIATMEELALYIEKHAICDKQKAVAQEVFDSLKDKYKTKTLALLSAQSRCISTMIAGPANFPARRAEKANSSQRKRSDEWLEFHNNLEKYALKNLTDVYSTSEKQATELEQYRLKVAANIKLQEEMKAVNKAHKAYLKDPDTKLMAGLSEAMQKVVKTYVPEYNWEPHPFAPYQLTNNNATIKRMKSQLAVLEVKNKAIETTPEIDQQFNGLTVRRNFEEDRLQLLFDDIPTPEVRAVLKSNGFRWSPRFTAWQRKLTSNALYATRYMLDLDGMKQFKIEV